MPEQMRKYFTKEEEFLDEFEFSASAAVDLLEGEWRPDYRCNDDARTLRKYALESGQLVGLVFDGAAVYHLDGKFSSVQILLRGQGRAVNVRVRYEGSQLVAEKVVDKPL